jgi:hypothetical protein
VTNLKNFSPITVLLDVLRAFCFCARDCFIILRFLFYFFEVFKLFINGIVFLNVFEFYWFFHEEITVDMDIGLFFRVLA